MIAECGPGGRGGGGSCGGGGGGRGRREALAGVAVAPQREAASARAAKAPCCVHTRLGAGGLLGALVHVWRSERGTQCLQRGTVLSWDTDVGAEGEG